MATSPVTQGTVRRLLTYKEHAVEMVESIIKETDLDPCVEQLTEDLGALGLFDLAKLCYSHILFYFQFSSLADSYFCFLASMRMKALQDRCIAGEGVICRLQKRQDIQNKEMDQHKQVVCTFNEELTAIIEKLKQESIFREKAQEAKESLETELKTLREQIEKAKVDAMVDFKASQSFIDVCAIYYGEGFDYCLKQVGSVYLDLDVSKISMDDPVSKTPAGGDTISEEADDSTQSEQDPKDDDVVLAQPVVEGPVAPLVLSTDDPPSKAAESPSTPDVENPSSQDAQNRLVQF